MSEYLNTILLLSLFELFIPLLPIIFLIFESSGSSNLFDCVTSLSKLNFKKFYMLHILFNNYNLDIFNMADITSRLQPLINGSVQHKDLPDKYSNNEKYRLYSYIFRLSFIHIVISS